jgi:predicted RNA-binding protein YlxR (DUF448 family)
MPRRTCIGCGLVREKGELLRFVSIDGLINLDHKGMFKGRGAYLCPDKSCIAAAYKKKNSFSRALRVSVNIPDKEELWELIRKGRFQY